MKLAKYLADYLHEEYRKNPDAFFVKLHHSGDLLIWNPGKCEKIIQQSIEAFVSTQQDISVSIDIWKRCECKRLMKAESYP